MMEAGPKLNALVAKEVMGLCPVGCQYIDWQTKTLVEGSQTYCTECDQLANCPVGSKRVKDYSGDISAAWEVVEKVTPTHPNFVLVYWVDSKAAYWQAGFDCEFEESWTYEATSETAPHAICLAALRAVGVEI